MTPRERAKQLVEKMAISISYGTNYTGGDDIPMYRNTYAKQCASIAIDEIIANIEPSLSMDIIESRIKYWNLIKQEIENI